MPEVFVENTRVDGSTVTCDVRARGKIRRFFTGRPFRVEYDVDVSDVPNSILTIPALAHVAPVAWTQRATVAVEAVDETFLSALSKVRNALRNMYPEFIRGGDVVADEVVDTPTAREHDQSAVLFSGGVDSTATYVRHRDEDPLLVSVHGWVVEENESERWERVASHLRSFADERGLENAFVRSNMLEALDTPMLQAHFKQYVDGAWYSSVGHGLGLLGLCAPLAYARGLDPIYIAATHTNEFNEPWGSHPTIDNNVAWAGTRGSHDGYELSRQEKVQLIADYAEREAPELTLRTCTSETADGGNCNDCEKCYRTAVGLWLAGMDPSDHGYELTDETLQATRRGFERGEWILGADEQFMWEDIQRHVDDDVSADAVPGLSPDAAEAFLDWLVRADFGEYVEGADSPLTARLLRGLARNVPHSVYASLYPVYSRFKQRNPQ